MKDNPETRINGKRLKAEASEKFMAHILIEGLLLTKVCSQKLLINPSSIKKEST